MKSGTYLRQISLCNFSFSHTYSTHSYCIITSHKFQAINLKLCSCISGRHIADMSEENSVQTLNSHTFTALRLINSEISDGYAPPQHLIKKPIEVFQCIMDIGKMCKNHFMFGNKF